MKDDNEAVRARLEQQLNFSTNSDMVNMVAFNIWGAAVTTTRAFKKVQIKIDAATQRVFIVVELRWVAKKLERFHNFWLKRCEERCSGQLPPGWRLLAYYDRGTDGRRGNGAIKDGPGPAGKAGPNPDGRNGGVT